MTFTASLRKFRLKSQGDTVACLLESQTICLTLLILARIATTWGFRTSLVEIQNGPGTLGNRVSVLSIHLLNPRYLLHGSRNMFNYRSLHASGYVHGSPELTSPGLRNVQNAFHVYMGYYLVDNNYLIQRSL